MWQPSSGAWVSFPSWEGNTVEITCVYLGFICDLAGGKTRETINLTEGKPTVRSLLDVLRGKYVEFEETFLDMRTGKMDPRREVLVRLRGSRTLPITVLKGLDTELSEGSRVVFW